MAETLIVLYLSHFWTEFAEFLYTEIFFPTWKACHFSSRSQRLQGQRPQGHKGQRPRKFETNFLHIWFICESISPTFEAQYPQYHCTYGNCQLCIPCGFAWRDYIGNKKVTRIVFKPSFGPRSSRLLQPIHPELFPALDSCGALLGMRGPCVVWKHEMAPRQSLNIGQASAFVVNVIRVSIICKLNCIASSTMSYILSSISPREL